MQTFTCTGTVFRHTIAAHDFEAAYRMAQAELGGGRVVLWATPDIWTRRAVEAAPLPGVVDAVPRFVVERGGGFSGVLELDHDNLPGNLRPGEAEALRWDSADHAAWLDAFQAVHKGGDALRRHVVDVATCRDLERHKRLVRALAGAYGLGPVPAWHVAILPALVALDAEICAYGGAWPDDALERDPNGLWTALADVDAATTSWRLQSAVNAVGLAIGLPPEALATVARERALIALVSLGWLR